MRGPNVGTTDEFMHYIVHKVGSFIEKVMGGVKNTQTYGDTQMTWPSHKRTSRFSK
jgi:hypothetical protein